MGIGALAGALLGLGASAILPAGTMIFGFSTGMLWMVGASIGSLFDAPKLDMGGSPNNSFGPLQNSETQLTPVPVVYGRRRVGGNIFFHRYLTEDRSEVDMFVSMSEGPISGISDIMASDQQTEDLTTSSFTSHLGTFPQSVDALAPSDKHLGYPGTAYVACHLESSSKLKGNPVISAIVEGRTIWTPPGASVSLGGNLLASFFKVVQGYNRTTGTWYRYKGSKFFEVEVSDIEFNEYELSEARYVAEYTGYLQPSVSGNYQFRFDTSSGFRKIYLDGEQITESTDIALVADQIYSLKAEVWLSESSFGGILSGTVYTHHSGGDEDWWQWDPTYYPSGTKQKLYWTPPGASEEIIPSAVLHGGLSGYSQNPVWCILDFLRNRRYGLGLPDEYFDIDFGNPDGTSSWEISAGYCDETVNGDPRFEMDIVLDQERSFIDHLQEMLSSFRGYLICREQITIHIEKYETSYQKLLARDNIIEGSFGFFIKPQDEIPNKIEVEWVDPSTEDDGGHWDRVIAVAQNDERILNEGVRSQKFSLLGITRQSQAQAMADYLLGQAENALLYLTFSLGLQDSDIEVGEVEKVDYPMLDEAKWVRVLKIEDGQNEDINILAIEYYIPDYDYSRSWEEDLIVRYDGHIYCSIDYVPSTEDEVAPSRAIASSEYNTVSYAKENAFDDPDLGETVWLSGESGTGVKGVSYIGQMFNKATLIQDIYLDQASVEVSLAKSVTSMKVQAYDPDTETWSDVQTFSGISGDDLFSLTTAQYFYGIRLLANCDLDTGKYWGVSRVMMFEKWADTTPVIGTSVNSTYWELVE